jgi:hypothetical protein
VEDPNDYYIPAGVTNISLKEPSGAPSFVSLNPLLYRVPSLSTLLNVPAWASPTIRRLVELACRGGS